MGITSFMVVALGPTYSMRQITFEQMPEIAWNLLHSAKGAALREILWHVHVRRRHHLLEW